MPILPNIGRKSPKMRALVAFMYVLLIAGSATMIYPFLIMLSGSVKGNVDSDKMDIFPRVVSSESVQFARFEEDRYSTLTALSAAYGMELFKASDAKTPAKADIEKYKAFIETQEFPAHFYLVQGISVTGNVMPKNFRLFRDELRRECKSVDGFNKRYSQSVANWNAFTGVLDTPLTKEFTYVQSPLIDRYLRFKSSRTLSEKVMLNIDGYYRNTVHGASPILAARCPKGTERIPWAEFVQHRLNCLFVRLDASGLALFQSYLVKHFPGGVGQMNKINDTRYPSFTAVKVSYKELRNSAVFALYTDFVTNVCPPEHLIVDTPGTRYRAYIVNESATVPFVAYDYSTFKELKHTFIYEALTRNYRSVIEYIAIYGRAIANTVLFIGLSVLAALIVNPLAAYALSRFRLKSTYSILMFFLATMAFPGAVTMIPNFLLLKQLHLLNTFWALVLPGAANGYSIFILKGFFDSIPSEVYESAMIDGAREWTMFWKFTMALSKPILALITLNAFTAAYTAFMFALIICPDEKMWTLMVWLYQMQQGASQPVVYASLVLAAIPTLLIFILAQNAIMKGIVIPVEK